MQKGVALNEIQIRDTRGNESGIALPQVKVFQCKYNNEKNGIVYLRENPPSCSQQNI